MKRLLCLLVFLLCCNAAFAQPILRQVLTTNTFSPSTNVVVVATPTAILGLSTTDTNAVFGRFGSGYSFSTLGTSTVATVSQLVWTNESSVYRIIGFPQADTNNYVVHDLSTAGSARTTLNAGTSGVGFVKWNTEMNAISAGETYGISEFIANDSTDEWSARLNIGTNAAANTEYLQFSLEKSSRGALAVLNTN